MATGMRVEDRLEGSRNLRSWKHRLHMILDENDLLENVTVGVLEPEEQEQKTKHRKREKKASSTCGRGRGISSLKKRFSRN
jgi:hypothetical protein